MYFIMQNSRSLKEAFDYHCLKAVEITDNAIPLKTKKATKFWMRLFNGT